MPESPVNAVCGVQLRYKPFTGAKWKYTSVTMIPAQELLIGPARVCERPSDTRIADEEKEFAGRAGIGLRSHL